MNNYEKFLIWAEEQGLKFPCTPKQIRNYARTYATEQIYNKIYNYTGRPQNQSPSQK